MRFLFHILVRLKRLKWEEITRLFFVCLTAFVVGMISVGVDISSVSLLLQNQGFSGIGFNYIMAGLVWALLGYEALLLERRRGYGSAWVMSWMALFWLGLVMFGLKYLPVETQNILFCSKYGLIFFVSVCFWTMAERFIRLSMTSLKFVGVFGFELVGAFVMAFWGRYLSLSTQLTYVGVLFIGLVVLLKILGYLHEVPAQTFIKKMGGVQDVSERRLLDVILLLSFCWTTTRLLVDAGLYETIDIKQMNISNVLSTLYMICSGVGFAVLMLLSQQRFLFTLPLGLTLICVGGGLTGFGVLWHLPFLVFGGVGLFWVCSHFYMQRYLSLLPVPLAFGHGIRIKRLRWLLMTPGAFILVGAMLLTIQTHVLAALLIGLSGALWLVVILSIHLYGRQLLKMCGLRFWRGGKFMLTYAPLKQMIRQGLDKKNPAEVIYFLTILADNKASGFETYLLKALHHPAISVRLFALKKLSKQSLNKKEKRVIRAVMLEDTCEEVRNHALALLILSDLESHERRAWQEYKEYLDQKEWVVGAAIGLLFSRGAWLNQVYDHVHSLAQSNKVSDQLKALMIMNYCPKPDWAKDVANLLNTSDLSVMKATLSVVGKLQSPALLPRLLTLLDEVRWQDHVLEALDGYGKTALPSIEKMILNELAPLERRKVLIGFLGRLPSGEGKQILLRCLFNATRMLRSTIIETLSDADIVWVHRDRKRILKKGILQDVNCWHEMHEMLANVEVLSEVKQQTLKRMFMEALNAEMTRTRLLILDQLNLYLDVGLMKQSVETLKSDDWNAYAGAISCLQDILPAKIYKKVRPVLKYPLENNPPEKMEVPLVSAYLNKFILNPPEWVTPWLQALALYGWEKTGDVSGLVAVEEGLKSPNWIVLEAALSALNKLEKNKKKIAELMLNIPTRYLLKQNLGSFVEEKHAHHH